MSYVNVIMYNAVIPTSDFDDKKKKTGKNKSGAKKGMSFQSFIGTLKKLKQ